MYVLDMHACVPIVSATLIKTANSTISMYDSELLHTISIFRTLNWFLFNLDTMHR